MSATVGAVIIGAAWGVLTAAAAVDALIERSRR